MRSPLPLILASSGLAISTQATGCQNCLGLNKEELGSLCKSEIADFLGQDARVLNVAQANCENFFVDYSCCYPAKRCPSDSTCLNPTTIAKRSVYQDDDPGIFGAGSTANSLEPRDGKAVCCDFAKGFYETHKVQNNVATFEEKKKAMLTFGGKAVHHITSNGSAVLTILSGLGYRGGMQPFLWNRTRMPGQFTPATYRV